MKTAVRTICISRQRAARAAENHSLSNGKNTVPYRDARTWTLASRDEAGDRRHSACPEHPGGSPVVDPALNQCRPTPVVSFCTNDAWAALPDQRRYQEGSCSRLDAASLISGPAGCASGAIVDARRAARIKRRGRLGGSSPATRRQKAAIVIFAGNRTRHQAAVTRADARPCRQSTSVARRRRMRYWGSPRPPTTIRDNVFRQSGAGGFTHRCSMIAARP